MKKIEIKGEIIPNDDQEMYDWFGIDAVSPKKVLSELGVAGGDDIEIEINSIGGDVVSASEISTAIRSYAGNKQINVVGLAASAASVIAMSAKSSIAPTALLMVHNASTIASGDYRDMQHAAELLKTVNKAVANAYMEKTGLSEKELFAIMDKETWMSAQDAVKNKFIDSIMFIDKTGSHQSNAFYNGHGLISRQTAEKIRNEYMKHVNAGNVENKPEDARKIMAQLELLRLKGEQK